MHRAAAFFIHCTMKKLAYPLLILSTFVAIYTFPVTQFSHEATCKPTILVKGEPEPIPLDNYLLGVLAGEMPASFPDEALRAQAYAARTYALRATDFGKRPIDRTTDAQVYLSATERESKWGQDTAHYEAKLTAGNHLRFEVKQDGVAVNPAKYIAF